MKFSLLSALRSLLLLAAICAAAPSWGQSVSAKISGSMTYNSSAETAKAVNITSRLGKRSTNLNYYLTVDPSSSSRVFSSASNTNTIPYQVYDASSAPRNAVLSLSEAVSASDVYTGVFPATNNPRATDTFYLVALPGGFAAAGQYTANLTVYLYSGTFRTGTLIASSTFSATLNVATILDVCVVPVGAPFDYQATSASFNLGILEAGETCSADLIARANTRYGLTISSLNGGVLRNTDAADTSTIGYSLSVDGSAMNLSSGTAVSLISGASMTTESGRRFRLTTQISSFDFPSSGSYSDTLTVSIVQN